MTQPDKLHIVPCCPTCGTNEWVYWDSIANSGKCKNKHLIDTDPSTGELYNSAKCSAE